MHCIFILLKTSWAWKLSGLHNRLMNCRRVVALSIFTSSKFWCWNSLSQKFHAIYVVFKILARKSLWQARVLFKESPWTLLRNFSHICLKALFIDEEEIGNISLLWTTTVRWCPNRSYCERLPSHCDGQDEMVTKILLSQVPEPFTSIPACKLTHQSTRCRTYFFRFPK